MREIGAQVDEVFRGGRVVGDARDIADNWRCEFIFDAGYVSSIKHHSPGEVGGETVRADLGIVSTKLIKSTYFG